MTSTIYITLICLAFVGAATAAGWSYDDLPGWITLNANCGKKSQSPINIVSANAKEHNLKEFDFSKYRIMKNANLTNNGHTLQVGLDGFGLLGGSLDGRYTALQLHFHWAAVDDKGSEHTLNGAYYPLEMHIVHMKSSYKDINVALQKPDGLAVLGFFFQPVSNDNKYLNEIVANADTVTSMGKNIMNFDVMGLISKSTMEKKYYRYQGSLTTPPCSESVVWTVFDEPLGISKKQMAKIRTVKDSHGKPIINFRPLQSLNKRDVWVYNSGTSKTFSVLVVFFSVLSYLS